MIKVLHLVSTLNIGGAEQNVRNLVTRMNRNIFQNIVVSMTDSGMLGEEIARLGIQVITLNMKKGVPDPRGILRLRNVIRKLQPDLIQTWMYHANLLGLLFSSYRPLLWNIRCSDMDLKRYDAIYRISVRAGVLCSKIPDIIITNSFAGKAVHEKLGYTPRHWEVIPNGFDSDFFHPDPITHKKVRIEFSIPQDAIVIGLVARLDPMKDHRTFFAAARILLDTHPNVHFVLAGRGIERSNHSIQPMLKDISGNLHLLGEQRNIPRIMASFDIATSSSMSEGLPNTIGESMAVGLPCVVTDVGDTGLLVDDTGVVVPPRNPEALAQAWKELIHSGPEYRACLGQKARERIQTQYSMAAMVGRYENLYRDIKKDYESHLRGSLCRR